MLKINGNRATFITVVSGIIVIVLLIIGYNYWKQSVKLSSHTVAAKEKMMMTSQPSQRLLLSYKQITESFIVDSEDEEEVEEEIEEEIEETIEYDNEINTNENDGINHNQTNTWTPPSNQGQWQQPKQPSQPTEPSTSQPPNDNVNNGAGGNGAVNQTKPNDKEDDGTGTGTDDGIDDNEVGTGENGKDTESDSGNLGDNNENGGSGEDNADSGEGENSADEEDTDPVVDNNDEHQSPSKDEETSSDPNKNKPETEEKPA